MKNMMKLLLFIAVMSVVSLVLKCSPGRLDCISGTGSSSEVTGRLFEPDGKQPARNVSVVMRSFNYFPNLQNPNLDTVICSTNTDNEGKFHLDLVKEGIYTIVGNKDTSLFVLIDSVNVGSGKSDSAGVHLKADTLKPPSTITGKIDWMDDSTEVYIVAIGQDVYANVNQDGSFALKHLPEGNHRLLFITFKQGGVSDTSEMKMVETQAGYPTTFDSLKVVPYTVAFDSRGGSAVASQTMNNGDLVLEPVPPTMTSCTFAGWFTETACLNAWVFTTKRITAPVTLYAKWIVHDIDGNIYTTVTIGNQVWLAENLKTTKYNDGASIPMVTDSSTWSNLETAGYCWHQYNEAANKNDYGALYNWYTVNTGKLAPIGWHVPAKAEWDTLLNYLRNHGYNWNGTTTGDQTGKSLAAQSNWDIGTLEGAVGNDLTKNNSSGFSALPADMRNADGVFSNNIGQVGCWWSSTDYAASNAWGLYLHCTNPCVIFRTDYKKSGLSIRCVRNE
jgi:uncharacterized protein (TIGR02145 family)